jgi:hypothetical protein
MMFFKKKQIGLVLVALFLSTETTPFRSHSSRLSQIQDSVAQTQGINLITGDYSLLSIDLVTTNKMNEVGSDSNFDAANVYALVYGIDTVLSIGNDSKAEPLRFPTSCLRTMFASSHMSRWLMINRAKLSSKQNNLLTFRRYYEKNTQSNYNHDVLFCI